uniref:Tetraspanin n=1 Tax=Trichobilharzia regenti TaxID=157069 RepID=A0AA85J6L2_TRIRE|nr:unnamed protein product [Trichobilharzia regenti]
MFVAKSHSILFTMNILVAILSILMAVGGGLFMLSGDMNFMFLRKTVTLLEKRVNPPNANFGIGVGKLIMLLTEKFSLVFFTYGFVNFLVCIVGMFAVCTQKSTLLTVFKDHLSNMLGEYMKDYISLRSGASTSIFAGIVMATYNCCGLEAHRYFWETPAFSPIDTYDNLLYKGLLFPVTCCKMDEKLKIVDKTCPTKFNKLNSNIGIGCGKPFSDNIAFITDMSVLSSLLILACNVIMMCITVKALRDLEPISI